MSCSKLLVLAPLGAVLLCGAGFLQESGAAKRMAKSFQRLPLEDQIASLRAMKELLHARLLTPSKQILRDHAALTRLEGVRVNRLLDSGPFDGLTLGRGGGAYFSFTSLTNDYDQQADLQLQQWSFYSGFAGGDEGYIVALSAPLDTITMEHVPQWLLNTTSVELVEDVDDNPEAVVGTSYIVRSIRWNESDLLVAIQVLEKDDYGITFAWRLLRDFGKPIR